MLKHRLTEVTQTKTDTKGKGSGRWSEVGACGGRERRRLGGLEAPTLASLGSRCGALSVPLGSSLGLRSDFMRATVRRSAGKARAGLRLSCDREFCTHARKTSWVHKTGLSDSGELSPRMRLEALSDGAAHARGNLVTGSILRGRSTSYRVRDDTTAPSTTSRIHARLTAARMMVVDEMGDYSMFIAHALHGFNRGDPKSRPANRSSTLAPFQCPVNTSTPKFLPLLRPRLDTVLI